MNHHELRASKLDTLMSEMTTSFVHSLVEIHSLVIYCLMNGVVDQSSEFQTLVCLYSRLSITLSYMETDDIWLL
jgi:hypothetical protein